MSAISEQISSAIAQAIGHQQQLDATAPPFIHSEVRNLPRDILCDEDRFKKAQKIVSASKRTITKNGNVVEDSIKLHAVINNGECSWITTCWAFPPKQFTKWVFNKPTEDISSPPALNPSKDSAFSAKKATTPQRDEDLVAEVARLNLLVAEQRSELDRLRAFKTVVENSLKNV